jgi:hypothetical protein
MAGRERIIDLAHQRYADVEIEEPRPESNAAMELAERRYREKALARVKLRAYWDPFARDLLIALGLIDE